MSKVLTSPVPEFPGTITLPDVLPIRKVAALDVALRESRETDSQPKKAEIVLPSMLDCLESFEIKGQPKKGAEDVFFYTPLDPAQELYSWILDSVINLVRGETSIPKEPPSVPTDTPQAETENQTS